MEKSSLTQPVSQNAMSNPPAPAKRETTFSPGWVCEDGFLRALDFELGCLVATMNSVNDGRFDGGVSPAATASVADTVLALFRDGSGAETGGRPEFLPKAGHIHLSAGGAVENISQAHAGAWLGAVDLSHGFQLGDFIFSTTVCGDLNGQIMRNHHALAREPRDQWSHSGGHPVKNFRSRFADLEDSLCILGMEQIPGIVPPKKGNLAIQTISLKVFPE